MVGEVKLCFSSISGYVISAPFIAVYPDEPKSLPASLLEITHEDGKGPMGVTPAWYVTMCVHISLSSTSKDVK